MWTVTSKNKVQIRLTDERWMHISIGHPEMASYLDDILIAVEDPEIIYLGSQAEQMAVREIENENKKIIVVYKEISPTDGFIITAFLSNKLNYLEKKQIIWQR